MGNLCDFEINFLFKETTPCPIHYRAFFRNALLCKHVSVLLAVFFFNTEVIIV